MLKLKQRLETSEKEEDKNTVKILESVLKEINNQAVDGKFDKVIERLSDPKSLEKIQDITQIENGNKELHDAMLKLIDILQNGDDFAAKRKERLANEKLLERLKEILSQQERLIARVDQNKGTSKDLAKTQDRIKENTKGTLDDKDPKDGKPDFKKSEAKYENKPGSDAKGEAKNDTQGPKGEVKDNKEGDAKEGKPGDNKAGDNKDGMKPGDGKEGDNKDGMKPSDGKGGENKDGMKPGEGKEGDKGAEAEHGDKPSDGKGGEAKNAKPGEGKEAGAKPGEGDNKEGNPGENKDGKGDGKPGDGKEGPKESKPGEGKGGEVKESKPGDGKEASKAGDGKGGEAKSGDPKDGKAGENKDGKGGDSKDGKPGDGKANESKSGIGGEGKPSEAKDGKGGDGKAGEGKEGSKNASNPGDKPGAGKEGKAGDGPKSGDGKPGEGKEGGKPGDGKSGESKAGQAQGGAKPGEGKGNEAKPGTGAEPGKTGKPGDGKPGAGDAKAGKPGDGKEGGKPGEGKPGDGKPGASKDGKPGDGKAGDGKPAESKSGSDQKGQADGKGEAKAGDPKSGMNPDGKPSESKGNPSAGQPSQGQPGQGKGDPSSGDDSPGGPKPPPGPKMRIPVRKQIEDGQKDMEKASEKLNQDDKPGALPPADKAAKDIEIAIKQLEEIINADRQEEIERILERLQARCARMLAMQIAVRDGTVKLDEKIEQVRMDKGDERPLALDSNVLSDREYDIVKEADRALALLENDGSAQAFAEMFQMVRKDMLTVKDHLGQTDTGVVTQGVENEIIKNLGDMVDALKKQREANKNKGPKPPPQPGQPKQPGEDPLVDVIAQLKLLRSMQRGLNDRTDLYHKEYNGEQAPAPDSAKDSKERQHYEMIQKEMKELADTEFKISKILKDMLTGKNRAD